MKAGSLGTRIDAGDSILVRWLDPAVISDAQLSGLTAVLDGSERAVADRFHFESDRRQYVVAHALLRGVVAGMTRRPAPTLAFTRRPGGKPELAAPTAAEADLAFSLSHTRTLVAVALGRGRSLGIDVEPVDRRAHYAEIAARHFSPDEAARVAAEGAPAFFRLWTLREAYLKATGEGLARPLRSFSFKLDPPRVDEGIAGRRWHFAELRPSATHCLALAVLGGEPGAPRLDLDARPIGFDELSGLLQ